MARRTPVSPALPGTLDLIYDWNEVERRGPVVRERGFELHDETIRDGIQNPSVSDPPIGAKLEFVHLLDQLGVASLDVGLPGAGARASDDALRLCREISEQRLAIRPGCAARTVVGDIRPIVEVSQAAGIPVEVMTFIGSSPIRQFAESWSVDLIRQRSVEAIDFAVREGLPVTYVTEDTTRSRPEVLRTLFTAAIDHGARRLCLCDTVGHATPDGVANLIRFTRHLVEGSGVDVAIDWHGHNDRGLGLANSLFALEHGANRVHGCVLGIGERVGNAPLDLLLINLQLLGELPGRDLSKLGRLCELVSQATGFPIPMNYPVLGQDAFRTGTGVHAAAIVKAKRKGDDQLANSVYSGVPASMVGRSQRIEIGPMSGVSNVTYWLAQRGLPTDDDLVRAVLSAAKQSDAILSEAEVLAVVEGQARRPQA